jgi:nitrite reductase/ring-hydroxylating ferredoxin subunit/DMSO/TMAO reductase YedYZ heme-binding membrane subunit
VYDLVMLGAVVTYVAGFVVAGKVMFRGKEAISDPILVIRAFGTCAIVMLHIVLCIGPLARLDRRFAALLYNRRHLGVCTFCMALLHAVLVLGYYGGFGVRNPVLAVADGYRSFGSVSGFPFEMLGLGALAILFVMAATSHDFWLKNLSPRVWKNLHMAVYGAYALAVGHVALGPMQSERAVVFKVLMLAGVGVVGTLHFVAGKREVRADHGERNPPPSPVAEGDGAWVDVCAVNEIPEKRARVVCLKGRERIAVFRYDGKVSAVSNVCAHQGGPLGEGKIVDGCITCPWHGYQYLPGNGQSPPPFEEKIPTYQVRVVEKRVLVNPEALPPGTPIEPAREGGNG